jgi:hypothetical protein
MPDEGGPQLTVAKTVTLPRADERDKVAFKLTREGDDVRIEKVSTANKVRCSYSDLTDALGLLK